MLRNARQGKKSTENCSLLSFLELKVGETGDFRIGDGPKPGAGFLKMEV